MSYLFSVFEAFTAASSATRSIFFSADAPKTVSSFSFVASEFSNCSGRAVFSSCHHEPSLVQDSVHFCSPGRLRDKRDIRLYQLPAEFVIYSKTRWNERVEAVTRVAEAVFAEPDEEEKKRVVTLLKGLPDGGIGKEWEPFWEPQAV